MPAPMPREPPVILETLPVSFCSLVVLMGVGVVGGRKDGCKKSALLVLDLPRADVCRAEVEKSLARPNPSVNFTHRAETGVLAQLVERLNGIKTGRIFLSFPESSRVRKLLYLNHFQRIDLIQCHHQSAQILSASG